MANANKLLISKNGYCLAKDGGPYLVFAKNASETALNLSNTNDTFEISWFNPRTGGELQAGKGEAVKGGGMYSLGQPPADANKDWVAIVRPAAANATFTTFGKPAKEKQEVADPMAMNAIRDFKFVVLGDFVPGYVDKGRKALAINAAKHKDKFAAAEGTFKGKSGTYDLVLVALTETDGESSYRVFAGGKEIGKAQNPETKEDYKVARHRFKGVELKSGDKIRVEFNSHSNGKIPEGDVFAFSRGRWRAVRILQQGK
jgi:hypothetical protein